MSTGKVIFATSRKRPSLTPSDAQVAAALTRRGVDVEARPWDAIPPGLQAGGLVCLRSTWDYHLRAEIFRAWITAFGATARLWNPVETVLWNLDKQYLEALRDRAVPLPPTRWFAPGVSPDLAEAFRSLNCDRLILKPRVSATAHGTYLIARGDPGGHVDWNLFEKSGALAQAFIPDVLTGEISLVYLGGTFSHAVLKTPAPGDFRVQSELGGAVQWIEASTNLRRLGDTVLKALDCRWMYARVDAVETRTGPLLMELELIEPELFFEQATAGAERLGTLLANQASLL